MRRLCLAALAILFISCASAPAPGGSTAMRPADAAVFDAVLQNAVPRPDARPEAIPVVYGTSIAPPPGIAPGHDPLAEALAKRSASPVDLETFNPGTVAIVVPNTTLDTLFTSEGPGRWTVFRNIFPDSIGTVRLTLPVYDRARRRAALYYQFDSPQLGRSGHLVLLHRTGKGWQVESDREIPLR